MPLLAHIFDTLVARECMACSIRGVSNIFCDQCMATVSPMDPSLGFPKACYLYQGPLKIAFQKAKFKPCEITARLLLNLSTLESACTTTHLKIFHSQNLDCITYIPLHWKRRSKRTFDLAYIFAQCISKKLKIPCLDLIRNNRLDPPLTLSKNKEDRKKMVSGRFRTMAKISGKNILLLDDITTTGATLDEGKRILSELGNTVTSYAFAQTPDL